MSDFDERSFFWKSWISPETRKRKKKKKNKCVKDEKKKKEEEEERVREMMMEQKEKKKKKKKNKAAEGSENTLFFTQQKEPQKKKKKKKKKVAFDLSAGHVPVVVSSSPGPTQVSDSDDVNSQDLFITQKTFRQQPITALHSPEGQKTLNLSPAPSKRRSCPSKRASGGPSTSTSSTQTENFFTRRLSTYLHFCQTPPDAAAVTPLDLSLQTRTRNHLDLDQRPASLPWRPSSGSQVKEAEEEAESSGDRRKDVAASSSPSESEVKSVDTTTSSEDGAGRQDLNQVRAVQTRLNESFFFKAKGHGQTHRPESPLMKLSLGRHVKNRRSLRSAEGH